MNLTFSLILKPTFLAIKDQFMLSMATSLAIRDYLTELLSMSVQIKWPNDIFVNEFKICGILIENQLSGDRLTNSVVGVGLNVNQTSFKSDNAASVATITGSSYELQEVLDGVLVAIEARYLQLRQHKIAQLRDEYHAHLYRRGVMSRFTNGSEPFLGEISGVDGQGKLQVLVNGEKKIFDTKEIAFADFNSSNVK